MADFLLGEGLTARGRGRLIYANQFAVKNYVSVYCWFSHDVTKILTSKLLKASITLMFLSSLRDKFTLW